MQVNDLKKKQLANIYRALAQVSLKMTEVEKCNILLGDDYMEIITSLVRLSDRLDVILANSRQKE